MTIFISVDLGVDFVWGYYFSPKMLPIHFDDSTEVPFNFKEVDISEKLIDFCLIERMLYGMVWYVIFSVKMIFLKVVIHQT